MFDIQIRYGALEDVSAVTALHDRCSEKSLYRRYHAPLPRISERVARRLLQPSGGWSLLAMHGDEIVGMALAAPRSENEVDLGLLVQDSHQRRGIGRRLLRDVAVEAAAHGYQALRCTTQPDNRPLLATAQGAGFLVRITWVDGLVEVVVPLRERSGSRSEAWEHAEVG